MPKGPPDNLLIPMILTAAAALAVGVAIVGWVGVATFVGFCALLGLLSGPPDV